MTVCMFGVVIALVGNLLWLNALERRVVKHQRTMDQNLALAELTKDRQGQRVDIVNLLEAKVDSIPTQLEKRIKPLENEVQNLANYRRLVEHAFGMIGKE